MVSLSWILRSWFSPIVTLSASRESTKLEDVLSFAVVPRTSGRGWRVSRLLLVQQTQQDLRGEQPDSGGHSTQTTKSVPSHWSTSGQ